jgi:hypothetical protein
MPFRCHPRGTPRQIQTSANNRANCQLNGFYARNGMVTDGEKHYVWNLGK